MAFRAFSLRKDILKCVPSISYKVKSFLRSFENVKLLAYIELHYIDVNTWHNSLFTNPQDILNDILCELFIRSKYHVSSDLHLDIFLEEPVAMKSSAS